LFFKYRRPRGRADAGDESIRLGGAIDRAQPEGP
jgi:hypothetical protein